MFDASTEGSELTGKGKEKPFGGGNGTAIAGAKLAMV
jgi:hypothetical protein